MQLVVLELKNKFCNL